MDIQSRQNKTCKPPDTEELEAYRASFGFSADEIVTTTNYVEISDVSEECMTPSASSKPVEEEHILTVMAKGAQPGERPEELPSPQISKTGLNRADGVRSRVPGSYNSFEEQVQKQKRFGDGSGRRFRVAKYQILSDDEDIYIH